MEVKNYRKKPITIKAIQFDGTYDQGREIINWLNSNGSKASFGETIFNHNKLQTETVLHIMTLEGVMDAFENYWIIEGVAGEFYPCKPEIFEATYDVVE